MGISDWISITSSVISAIAAVIGIGLSVFVYWQGRKHDYKVDERDERRHYNAMDQNMKQFLYQYYLELPYLPLGYIAMAYDSDRIYVRSLYSMLRIQNREIQEMIAEKFGLQLLLNADVNIYDICYKKARSLFDEKGASNGRSDMMYDRGKYWERTISRYSASPLISDFCDVSDFVTEVLSGRLITFEENQLRRKLRPFRRHIKPKYSILNRELQYAKKDPIQYIYDKLKITECDENRCCQCISIIVYWLAEYHSHSLEVDVGKLVDVGELDDIWESDDKQTAEDLFLRSLLAVYLCVLADGKGR